MNKRLLMNDLTRYLKAQEYTHEAALRELCSGCKVSHWSWWEIPQITGLGMTSTSREYAIRDLKEAKAYLENETLRARLLELCDALLSLDSRDPKEVMGYPDNLKLCSCMTLFLAADPENRTFRAVLEKYFDGKEDRRTLEILKRQGKDGSGQETETAGKPLHLQVLPDTFCICKVPDYSMTDLSRPFVFTGNTDVECSLVCPVQYAPQNTISRDDGWRAFRIIGELDFSLIGILADIAQILAAHRISIFAVSTYNTDYVLTKAADFDHAMNELSRSGYQIENSSSAPSDLCL